MITSSELLRFNSITTASNKIGLIDISGTKITSINWFITKYKIFQISLNVSKQLRVELDVNKAIWCQ